MRKLSSNLIGRIDIIVMILIGIFYFFFLGDIGYILEADSMTFITIDLPNYWLYTSFLNVCESIFGDPFYLEMVNVIQGVLAVLVSLIVTLYFKRRFQLQRWESLLIYVATFLPYGYSLPESVATHHILTEGLSFSFFHLFLLFIMIVFLDKRLYMMLPAGIMLLLLIGTRSQLLLLLPVYIGIWIILGLQWIYRKLGEKTKKIFWGGLLALSIVICMLIPTFMKMIAEKGVMLQFVDAMAGRVLCTIEESDIDYVEEPYREVCQYVYEKIDKKETRNVYFRDGLRRWEDILYSTNENTKGIKNWINEYYSLESTQIARPGGEINYLTATLFERHLATYLEMTIALCVQSFVASIFIHPDIIYTLCHVITLFLYLATIALVIIDYRVRGTNEARLPMYLTMLVLVANVIITNLFFFGQQRYVVYTFGFFYISLFLLCRDIWKMKSKNL